MADTPPAAARTWYTLQEVAAHFGADETTFRRLIRAGLFPHGTEISKGLIRWSRSDVEFWERYVEIRHRLFREERPRKRPEKNAPP